MNLFFLDLAAKQSARYHCDKHVVKLILEATQMLYSVWHICSPNEDWKIKAPSNAMKLTHKNHPLSVWVRTNNKTYDIVSEYCHSLMEEYTLRYGKIHSSKLHMDFLTNNYPSLLPKTNDKPPIMPLCMPDTYKVIPTKQWSDVVDSYRAYYIGEKLHFCSYKGVDWPTWLPPKPVGLPKPISKKASKKAAAAAKLANATTTTTSTSTTVVATAKTLKTKTATFTTTTSSSVSKKVLKTKTNLITPPPPPSPPSLFNPAVSSIKTRSQSKI